MSAESQLTSRRGQIVAAARELLEQEGAEGLSMRRIADRLGIRAPSLYKHFPDKRAVEAALISEGFGEWANAAEQVAHDDDDDDDDDDDARLAAIGKTYRSFARSHPHLYRLMTERPLPREALVPGAEERAARPVIEAAGGDADLARAVWAFAHGMVILELNDRFPPDADLDAAWRRGLEALAASRPTPSATEQGSASPRDGAGR